MTTRTATTVCVVTGNDRRVTRQFLGHLASSLDKHDNVLLIGPGRPSPADPASWRLPGAGGALKHPERGVPSPRPVVVFVEERVELPSSWLELLVEAVEREGVAAVAPRSNLADGEELYLGVPYRPSEQGVRRAFTRERAASDRTRVTDVEILMGPCLALRRELLDTLGGFGEAVSSWDPAALSRAASATGRRLVVAEGCYLHHAGGASLRPDPVEAGRPFLSACLIVKDEEDELPTCLASLEGVVDEIVVYDTGSSDRTVEIAEAAGARVVAGYWDDDFGRARNDALAHCRGQWIVWVDADESLVCADPAGLRHSLATLTTDLEAFVVVIENQHGTKAGSTFTHPACRLFRRAYAQWEGHLHELVRARAGSPELARQLTDAIRINHRGYLQSHLESRGKGERNLRTAFGDLAGGSKLPFDVRLVSLGRSYTVAGRAEEGVQLLRRALEITELPSTARLALRTIVNGLLVLGRPHEALEEVERLRALSSDQTLADALAGSAYLVLGEHEQALACFARVRTTIDEDGFEYSASNVAVPRAEALQALARPGEAAEVLLASIRESGGVDAHVGLLIECLELAGRALGEIYTTVGPERVEHFVPQLLQLQPAVADRALDAWHILEPSSATLLAAAAKVAPKLDVSRQLVWSSRLRAAGYALSCPLVASASDPTNAPLDRVLSAAAANAMFADPRARYLFGPAVLATPDSLDTDVRAAVSSIAPGLVPVLDALGARGSVSRGEDSGLPADRTGRAVLVVDRVATGLRATSVAAGLARAGHRVTLLQPLPEASPARLPVELGVTVRGFPGGGRHTWLRDCQAAIALASATETFDTVVIAGSASALLPLVRAILPRAAIVLDGDEMPPPADGGEHHGELDGTPTDQAGGGAVAISMLDGVGPLYSRQHETDLSARSGVCVVGDTRTLELGEAEQVSALLATLGDALADVPVTLLGDDPERWLARNLPLAISVPVQADPLPWLRAARTVLVAGPSSAEHWMASALACGTPALRLDGASDLQAGIGTLLHDDDAWRVAALSGAAPVGGEGSKTTDGLGTRDPLATLPETTSTPKGTADIPLHVRGVPGVRVTVGIDEAGELERVAATLRALLAETRGDGDGGPGREIEVHLCTKPDTAAWGGRDPLGALVLALSWCHGGLPAEWVAPIRDCVDELWVPSRWARDCAVASGLPESQVAVVPFGVDLTTFSPDGRPHELRTGASTRLLYVGPCTERAGFDVVLECYLATFSARDDICLVVSPLPGDPTAQGTSFARELTQAAAAPGPALEIVDGPLDDHARAALYRSCSVLVHTPRADATARPLAEAMACGLPVIALDDGPAGELCGDDVGWPVPSRRLPITPSEWTPSGAGAWWSEANRASVIDAMRSCLAAPEDLKAKGSVARQRSVTARSPQQVQRLALARLEQLARP